MAGAATERLRSTRTPSACAASARAAAEPATQCEQVTNSAHKLLHMPSATLGCATLRTHQPRSQHKLTYKLFSTI